MKATISIAALVAVSCTPVFAELARVDFTARSAPEIDIAIREIIDRQQLRAGDPVILLHGARVPGIPSFDLDVPGGSLAADLAKAGLATYVVDLRGYGRSTRPPAMTVPPRPTEPLVRSGDAVADLGAAVDAVLARTGAHHVSILGWATGGHWAGMYAALQPEKVSKVVFYNALYGYTEHHPSLGRGSSLADPDHPGFFNVKRYQNYRFNEADGLLTSWDRSIAVEDKTTWRDPAVAAAYVSASLASDPTADGRDPASFRAPSGALADSFLLAIGAAYWMRG